MATRISLLNDDDAVWNDRDFMTGFKDFLTDIGSGFLNVHRDIEHLQNAGFEEGSGSLSADDWIGSDAYNAWYGFIEGTATIEIDTVTVDEGSQSLKIDQTVNSGSQSSGVRLTENAAPSSVADERHLIPVKGGKTIKLEFALETSSISSGASGGAQAAIRQYDENLVQVGSEEVSTYVTGTQSYTDDEIEVTLEDDAKYIQVELRIDNETGTAYFDDLVLTEVGTDMEVTAQTIPSSDLDIETGVCFFEITDGSSNVFTIRFEIEVAETIAITNNVSGNDRIDVIYAFYDNTVDLNADASNVGSIEVVEGTPAASPVAPSVPANGYKIAEVYVANGASVYDDSVITDYRTATQMRNNHQAPATGQDQTISHEQAKAPATEVQLGQVVVEGTPTDPSRPKVPSMNYAGLPTAAQLADLLANIQTEDFTLGEAYPISDIPKVWQLDENNNSAEIYTTNWKAQTFTTAADQSEVGRVDLLIGKEGTPTDTLTIEIYAVDGSSHPTGAALASATLKTLFIQGDYSSRGIWVPFEFTTPASVSPSTEYAIVAYFASAGGSTSSNVHWLKDTTTPYADGQGLTSSNSGSSWSSDSSDFGFVMYGDTDEPYPLYLESGEYTELLLNADNSTNNNGQIYTTNQKGQNFFAFDFDYITRAEFWLETFGTVSGSLSVLFELYAADANGDPTGSAIWSDTDTITNYGITTTNQYINIDVGQAVTQGDQYVWVISMAAGGDASNYLNWTYGIAGGTDWVRGQRVTSSDGGSTWSDGNTTHAMRMFGYLQRTQGEIFRCDPAHVDRWKPIGWKSDNTAEAAATSVSVRVGGKIDILSSLTTGLEYYIPVQMDIATNGADPSDFLSFGTNAIGDNYFSTYFRGPYAIGYPMHIPWLGGASVLAGVATAADTILSPENAAGHKMTPFCKIDDYNQDLTQDTVIKVPKRAKMAIGIYHYTIGSYDTYGRVTLFKYDPEEVKVWDRDSGDHGISFTWDADAEEITISDDGTTATRAKTEIIFLG